MIKPMLAHQYEDYKHKLIFPVWSQPKLDGLRAIATKDGLFSRLGNRFMTVPHIERALQGLFQVAPHLVLDGELYCHTHRDNFPELCSIIKRTIINDDVLRRALQIEYWVFDVINGDITTERLGKAQNIVASIGSPHIKYLSSDACHNNERLDNCLANYYHQGYEGQIIRGVNSLYVHRRSTSLLKRKGLDTEVCTIRDVLEGEGKWLGMAGCFWCQHPNGQFFHAALADDDAMRRKYWLERDSLRGKHAEVIYQKLLPSGVPRHPRIKGIITPP